MLLLLERFYHGPDETLGLLFVNSQFECFTLEDEYRKVKVPGETRIPAGVYDIVKRMSPKWGKEMLYIEPVPGFTGIAIHAGNTTVDTEGCPLVGKGLELIDGKPFLSHSAKAKDELYTKVMPAIGVEAVEIHIVDRG